MNAVVVALEGPNFTLPTRNFHIVYPIVALMDHTNYFCKPMHSTHTLEAYVNTRSWIYQLYENMTSVLSAEEDLTCFPLCRDGQVFTEVRKCRDSHSNNQICG